MEVPAVAYQLLNTVIGVEGLQRLVEVDFVPVERD